MPNILFICTGNTCRSPMAEALCRDYIEKNNLENYTCQSAGISVAVGEPMSWGSKEALGEMGISADFHKAKAVTLDMLTSADKIYCMTDDHKLILSTYFPQISDKLTTFSKSITDPYGGNFETYQRCRDEIIEQIETVVFAKEKDNDND